MAPEATTAEKAKELVAEAKADGVSPSFTTSCIATPRRRNGLAVTQRNGQAIGLDGINQFLDQGAYVNKVIGAAHEFTIGCFRSPQLADADGLYNVLHTGGSGNVVGLQQRRRRQGARGHPQDDQICHHPGADSTQATRRFDQWAWPTQETLLVRPLWPRADQEVTFDGWSEWAVHFQPHFFLA